ncbi:MAG: hypothetical protein KVP17_002357 [Porospora cf. gigantea B]|uniref:uncharacterized protein n=1 Tax=Porospora cf. gigantea B TaxID=2853592 RepID=UPI003571F0CB|nr:MAG: hypothetical protein KVP17_002357 [Porospora cf. gigantea B]
MLVARIDDPHAVPELLKCVFVENISDPCLFWRFLIEKLPKIMTTVKVRRVFFKTNENLPQFKFFQIELLVVDSIAGLFRELPSTDIQPAIASRARNLCCVMSLLKALLYRGGAWALVTNQVASHNGQTTSALGLCWRHMPDDIVTLNKVGPLVHRLTVAKHSTVGPASELFSLSDKGVVGWNHEFDICR